MNLSKAKKELELITYYDVWKLDQNRWIRVYESEDGVVWQHKDNPNYFKIAEANGNNMTYYRKKPLTQLSLEFPDENN